MNTKLALSALVAALMLAACAKQEAASTDTAPAADTTTEEAAPADTMGSADATAESTESTDATESADASGTAEPAEQPAPEAPQQ